MCVRDLLRCARFDYGSCTSPLTRETIRPEVYYNQDLEVVMNTWGDQVRRKRHGTTMSWVQRFCADTVVICPDGRSYTEEEAHKFKLRWCYLNRALKKVAMEVAALDVLSVQQQQDLEPVAERYWAGAAPVTRWGARRMLTTSRCVLQNGATVVGAPAGADRMPILERRLRTPRNPRA